MVSGRELNALASIFPELGWFDEAVLENGAVLFHPESRTSQLLTEPPPASFVARLHERHLPMHLGQAIVATWEPHEAEVHRVIKELGLELQVTFKKGAVMVLPNGVNKATGLRAALQRLGIDAQEVAGVGDAENDHAFLEICGLSAAVANALPAIKERVQWNLEGDHGSGVVELIDRILAQSEVVA